MKPLSCSLVRFLAMLFVLGAVAPRAISQQRPRLVVELAGDQPSLTLTGVVGTVYSIQYATGLSPTAVWVDRTLLEAQGASNVWSDPSAPTPGQRFYRAVSVAAPVDTNLVFIQPRTFMMGSPTNEAERDPDETQHTVTISRGFWMEKYLVTQGDYLAVVGTNPSFFRNGTNGSYFGGTGSTITNELSHPVEQVSWTDATNYCGMRTEQERAKGLIATNYVYRLPTEAEWEYADRAGTTTALYLGSSLHSGQVNFNGQFEYDAVLGTINNPSGIFIGTTTSVGSYTANPWGLYDMIGNLFEWCQDWYDANPPGSAVDPQGPATGPGRLIRGGRWGSGARNCRSAYRGYDSPDARRPGIGFRVVLAPGQ